MNRAGLETLQFNDHMVVNILMNSSDQSMLYEEMVKQARTARN